QAPIHSATSREPPTCKTKGVRRELNPSREDHDLACLRYTTNPIKPMHSRAWVSPLRRKLHVPVRLVDEMFPLLARLERQFAQHHRPARRPDQRHARLLRRPGALAGVAPDAGADDVLPRGPAAPA